MANQQHLEILNTGVQEWNIWRQKHPNIRPDLRGANLSGKELSEVHFNRDLSGEIVGEVHGAQPIDLSATDLAGADLSKAKLVCSNLHWSNLSAVNLRGATLVDVDLTNANLTDADFTEAEILDVNFATTDLTTIKGLDSVIHHGPSYISIETLYRSGLGIPEVFLRGCGVPDELITYLPALLGAARSIEFYSCFISYSHKDEEFAQWLYSRMRDEHLRVWFAPEEMKGGQKLHEQIDQAIQVHDRLLLVLSESSIQSEWVLTEIRNARKVETQQKRRKLFPIRLVDFETIKGWNCFDAGTGKDLGVEVREYFIPDFSKWKDPSEFETAFERLLRDLKAQEAYGDVT